MTAGLMVETHGKDTHAEDDGEDDLLLEWELEIDDHWKWD